MFKFQVMFPFLIQITSQTDKSDGPYIFDSKLD